MSDGGHYDPPLLNTENPPRADLSFNFFTRREILLNTALTLLTFLATSILPISLVLLHPPSPFSHTEMGDSSPLPIIPTDDSLQAHLLALDLLSARLTTLTSRTRWPTRIPLTSKASFHGSIVHTNDLKVDVGAGWWVEMTTLEAGEYVQRRKMGESGGMRWGWECS